MRFEPILHIIVRSGVRLYLGNYDQTITKLIAIFTKRTVGEPLDFISSRQYWYYVVLFDQEIAKGLSSQAITCHSLPV